MRKLVLLVSMAMALTAAYVVGPTAASAGVIPSWQDPSGRLAFNPITNEISLYQNYDDAGVNRGRTVQVVAINSFRLLTEFSFEFTADFNFDFATGLNHDYYMELSLVKPVTALLAINYQRIISTFEPEPVNQFGLRLRL